MIAVRIGAADVGFVIGLAERWMRCARVTAATTLKALPGDQLVPLAILAPRRLSGPVSKISPREWTPDHRPRASGATPGARPLA
jgi:hypothetical protein